jgi:hypothetical protein
MPLEIDYEKGTIDGKRPLAGKIDEVRAVLEKPYSREAALALVADHFARSRKIQDTLSTMDPETWGALRKRAHENGDALLFAYGKLKRPETYGREGVKDVIAPGTPIHAEIAGATIGLYDVVSDAIALHIRDRGTIRDAPSSLLAYLGEQLRKGLEKGLGIPAWVAPVSIMALIAIALSNFYQRGRPQLPPTPRLVPEKK